MKLPTLTASIKTSHFSLQASFDDLSSRAILPSGNDLPREVWWCVRCESGLIKSQLGLTEIDALIRVCGVNSGSVTRGRCPE